MCVSVCVCVCVSVFLRQPPTDSAKPALFHNIKQWSHGVGQVTGCPSKTQMGGLSRGPCSWVSWPSQIDPPWEISFSLPWPPPSRYPYTPVQLATPQSEPCFKGWYFNNCLNKRENGCRLVNDWVFYPGQQACIRPVANLMLPLPIYYYLFLTYSSSFVQSVKTVTVHLHHSQTKIWPGPKNLKNSFDGNVLMCNTLKKQRESGLLCTGDTVRGRDGHG